MAVLKIIRAAIFMFTVDTRKPPKRYFGGSFKKLTTILYTRLLIPRQEHITTYMKNNQ